VLTRTSCEAANRDILAWRECASERCLWEAVSTYRAPLRVVRLCPLSYQGRRSTGIRPGDFAIGWLSPSNRKPISTKQIALAMNRLHTSHIFLNWINVATAKVWPSSPDAFSSSPAYGSLESHRATITAARMRRLLCYSTWRRIARQFLCACCAAPQFEDWLDMANKV
jgi:hypothetical protein